MKYRLGRKKKRAILDESGHEVVMVKKGNEEMVQQICDYLNVNTIILENMKQDNVIVDFNMTTTYEGVINVYLQPVKSLEYINVDIKIIPKGIEFK